MAFEDIKAEIALLFEQMVNQPQDAHEIRETVRGKLNQLRRCGPVVCLCLKIWSSLKNASKKISIPENGSGHALRAFLFLIRRSGPQGPHASWLCRGAQRLQHHQ